MGISEPRGSGDRTGTNGWCTRSRRACTGATSYRTTSIGALAVNQLADVVALPRTLQALGGTVCLATITVGDALEELAEPSRMRWLIAAAALLAPIVITTHTLVRRVLPLHRSRGPGFAEAEMLAGAADACVIWTSRRAHGNLRYYFPTARVIDAAEPLIRLYHSEPAPEVEWTRAAPCVVASVWHLDPRYSVGGYDGYGRRAEWSRYFGAVTGLEGAGSRGIRTRSFTSVRRADVSVPYLRFSSDREEFPDSAAWVNALAAAAGGDFASAVGRALFLGATQPLP